MTSPFKAITICILASLFYCFDYFVQVTPSVLSHTLISLFNLNAFQLSFLGSCFFIPYAIMQIPVGFLLPKYGARYCLSLAALSCSVALIAFACSSSYTITCLSRGILGISSAFSFISAVHLVYELCPKRLFSPLIGAIQFSATLGSIIGLAPIAAVTHYWGWKIAITVMATFSLCLSITYFFIIKDTLSHQSNSNNFHIKSCISYLINHKRKIVTFCIGFISWMPIGSIGTLWGVPFLIATCHLSTTRACHYCSALWLGLGTGSIFIGWLSERIQSRKKPTLICFALCTLSSMVLIHANHFSGIILSLSLFFIGFSASNQALSFSFIKDQTPSLLFTSLSAINNMFAILGGAASQQLIGCLLTWQTTAHNKAIVYTAIEYQHAFILIPTCSVIGFIVTLLYIQESHPMSRHYKRTRHFINRELEFQ